MKYLALAEQNYKDFERIKEIWEEILKERAKGSDKFPKTVLFNPHMLDFNPFKKSRDVQSFWIFETDDPMHLINYRMHLAPYMDVKFIPISDGVVTFETWLGMER